MELGEIFSGGTTSILATLIGFVVIYMFAKKLIKIVILIAIGVAAYSYFTSEGAPDLSGLSGSASSTAKSASRSLPKSMQ
jgi:hypothetical protein